MKKIIITISSLLLLMATSFFTGCTGNFEEINTNPNSASPGQVDPKFMLTTALNRTILTINNFQNIQLLQPDIYAQFYANDLGVNYNSYNQVDQGISSFWTDIVYYYVNSLNTIIRTYGDVPAQTNVVQMARIWKSWLVLRATDFWGDIPYFKAGDGSAEVAAYDKQQDIYDDIFKTLADAVTKFDATKSNPGTQDILFMGSNAKWIKFANSLRLRMAMRISHVDPARAKAEAEAAIAGGLISSSSERASMLCDNSLSTSQNPIANIFSQGGFGMSLTMQQILTGIGGQAWPATVIATVKPATVDPRGPIMFDPSSTAAGASAAYVGRWKGTRPGLGTNTDETATFNNARIGKYVNGNILRPFHILKYSEVCFLLAEAKLRFPSWNTGAGTAESWYTEGIKDNMTEWGVPAAVTSSYLANTDANLNGTTVPFASTSGANNTQLDKVITQKWLALFPEGGWEAWADHRRLQKPKFIPFENVNSQWFPGAYNNTLDAPESYIRRAAYPVSEQTRNKENLDKALEPLGGQYVGYVRKPMWWDPYNEDGSLKPGATP